MAAHTLGMAIMCMMSSSNSVSLQKALVISVFSPVLTRHKLGYKFAHSVVVFHAIVYAHPNPNVMMMALSM